MINILSEFKKYFLKHEIFHAIEAMADAALQIFPDIFEGKLLKGQSIVERGKNTRSTETLQ